MLDHRGQGRRLTATGGPGDQDQALIQLAQVEEHIGQVELRNVEHRVGNQPERCCQRAALQIDVATKPRQPLDAVTQIYGEVALELRLLVWLQDRREHLPDLFGLEIGRLQRLDPAVDSHQRRTRRLQVQVRRTLLQHQFEELVDLHRWLG